MSKKIHSNSLRGLSEDETKIAKNFIFTDHPLLNYVKHPDFSKKKKMAIVCKQVIPTINESWYDAKMSDADQDALPEEISKTLLTKEEEESLFLKYNYLRYQIFSLKRSIAKKGKAGILELISLYKDLSKVEKTIAAANLKIVIYVAQFFRKQADWNDLISEGNGSLINAIRNFDLMRGYKFSTLAYTSVKNDLIDYIKERKEIDDREKQITDEDWNPEAKAETEDNIKNIIIIRTIIDKNLVELTDKELKIINMRFPRGDEKEKTRTEIGKEVGLSGEAIRKIEQRIINKIRNYIRTNSKELGISDEILV
jgi:RNA polymerase sigma factor (sigma-70 family)